MGGEIMNNGYDNIMNLARENNYKKIMIMRNSWGEGNWCRVDKVIYNPDGKYGKAFGFTHYRDGNEIDGEIKCAGNYSWRVIKVLDEDLEVMN
jgi:hypothetical protein